MVFRIKHKYLFFLFIALIITLLFCLPYFVKDLLPIEHDTFFHLSRIEGLAKAIKNHDYLPAIYPDKNGYFGYASPLFYCDLFLYPVSLLYLLNVPLSICYKILIFIETFLAAYSIQCLLHRISKSYTSSFLSAIAYTFANYHITDVYVRGALGEVQAMIFLPILIEGIYIVFYEENTKQNSLITLGLVGLLLSHNLTFVLCVFVCILFCLLNIKKRRCLLSFTISTLWAFLITIFFSLPMLEQLHSNTYYLNYYASSSDLAKGALPLWKYFANSTTFGYSDNTLEHSKQMILNVGYFLTFVPILYLFKKEKNAFIKTSLILGYICILIPSTLLPWSHLSFFRVLQFPWRFLQLAQCFLTIPACVACTTLFKKKYIPLCISSILVVEGIYHVLPITTRTFGLTSDMDWSDVLESKLTDPYYSATYKRVELAGGDYLPLPSIDYRTISNTIMDENYTTIAIPSYTYDSFTFELDTSQTVILPKTWYKGYKVYQLLEDGTKVEIDSTSNEDGLLTIQGTPGKYLCTYSSTPLRIVCIWISSLSCIAYIVQKKMISIKF